MRMCRTRRSATRCCSDLQLLRNRLGLSKCSSWSCRSAARQRARAPRAETRARSSRSRELHDDSPRLRRSSSGTTCAHPGGVYVARQQRVAFPACKTHDAQSLRQDCAHGERRTAWRRRRERSLLRRALQQSGTRRHASGHEIYKAGQIHYRRPWERETQPGRLSLSRSTTSHEAFCSLGGTRSMIGSLADGSLATRSTGGFTGSDWRPWVHAERGLLHAERSNERSSSVAGRHVGQNDGAAPAHTRGSA